MTFSDFIDLLFIFFIFCLSAFFVFHKVRKALDQDP